MSKIKFELSPKPSKSQKRTARAEVSSAYRTEQAESSLSQQLNLITVAEGIEKIDQLLWLQKHGFHLGQGYFWHPSLAADAATELIASESRR